jgi:GT2 family glycosyltransferase
MTPPSSVVVCTTGRRELLERCVASLVEQIPAADIVVVDNGPLAPDSRVVCERTGTRYVREPRRGSGPARNAGLRAARGELMAYVDDDCLAEPGWLQALLDPFAEADVHAVAGQVVPFDLATPAQRLLERYFPYSKGTRRRSFGPGPRGYPFPLNANEMGTGANMAFRRSTLCQLGGFVDALSAGGPARGGEDLYAFYAVLRAGHRLVYEPAARVRHAHPASEADLERLLFDYGVAHFAYLTHCLVAGRDARVVRRAAAILAHYARRLCAPGGSDLPRRHLLRHLAGSCVGPAWYLVARRDYG